MSPNHSLDIEAEHHKVVSRFTRQILDLENLRMEWKATKGANLLSLLHRFWDRKATNERDKIYALLSLANKGSLFAPDYSVSVHKLLTSWVRDWSAIFEESDYRRIALHGAYNVCSGWGIVASETESEYWASVAEQIDLLVRDLKKPDKRPRGISVQLREALVDYINFLIRYETIYQQEIEPEIGPLRAYEIYAGLTFSGERGSYSLRNAPRSTTTNFGSVLAKVVTPNEEMAKLQSKIVGECKTDFLTYQGAIFHSPPLRGGLGTI
ncbi:hypothetical protein NUW58_g183 [Xylaria curta]|uniref:Uncharacterized protein n=1 Tax=Xylaria curta TaxID=42375 RepID=A0ACC1PRA9_9PEZI|nr:hypothetical protein NUW58_g183 [Xylaria curta]